VAGNVKAVRAPSQQFAQRPVAHPLHRFVSDFVDALHNQLDPAGDLSCDIMTP
jgi:hypothetical protein